MEEKALLDTLLGNLWAAVRDLVRFQELVTPEREEYLSFVPEEEQEKLHAEVEWSERYEKKFKFAPQISEGKRKIYQTRVRGSDGKLRRAWLYLVYDDEGQLVARIYFDDGNVRYPEIKEAFAAIESRYKQRQRGGRRRTGEPLFREARAQLSAGKPYKEVRKWLVGELQLQILREWEEAGKKKVPVSFPNLKTAARHAAHKRASRFFRTLKSGP